MYCVTSFSVGGGLEVYPKGGSVWEGAAESQEGDRYHEGTPTSQHCPNVWQLWDGQRGMYNSYCIIKYKSLLWKLFKLIRAYICMFYLIMDNFWLLIIRTYLWATGCGCNWVCRRGVISDSRGWWPASRDPGMWWMLYHYTSISQLYIFEWSSFVLFLLLRCKRSPASLSRRCIIYTPIEFSIETWNHKTFSWENVGWWNYVILGKSIIAFFQNDHTQQQDSGMGIAISIVIFLPFSGMCQFPCWTIHMSWRWLENLQTAQHVWFQSPWLDDCISKPGYFPTSSNNATHPWWVTGGLSLS